MQEHLFHTTEQKNKKSILENGFYISRHIDDNKILWLGDGVYAWESNYIANTLGKSLVERKKGNKRGCSCLLNVILKYNKNQCLDLTFKDNFYELLDDCYSLIYAKYYDTNKEFFDNNEQLLFDTFSIIVDQKIFENKPYGNFLANMINEVLEYKKRVNGIEIKLLKAEFRQRNNNNLIKEKNVVKQICIRNCDIIINIS